MIDKFLEVIKQFLPSQVGTCALYLFTNEPRKAEPLMQKFDKKLRRYLKSFGLALRTRYDSDIDRWAFLSIELLSDDLPQVECLFRQIESIPLCTQLEKVSANCDVLIRVEPYPVQVREHFLCNADKERQGEG